MTLGGLPDARNIAYIFVTWTWHERCRIDSHHQGRCMEGSASD